jgi:hypothetical protein
LLPRCSDTCCRTKTKQETSSDSTTAAKAAPAAKQSSKTSKAAAAAAPSQDNLSSAVPAADHAAAAAGQALSSLSQQVDTLAAAFQEAPGSSPASSITPDFLAQLQEAVARMVNEQQGAAQGPTQGADSSTAEDADAVAVLAVLRNLMGPDAMSLLPVLLVTSATAAAGLMLAASMSGVAGLVDKRRGRLRLLLFCFSAQLARPMHVSILQLLLLCDVCSSTALTCTWQRYHAYRTHLLCSASKA